MQVITVLLQAAIIFCVVVCISPFTAPVSNYHYNKLRKATYLCAVNDYNAVMIVPTGIGATIGGYAGDALPSARLLSTVVDNLITHPNVMNGAMMYWPTDNILYVEGSSLDFFAAGKLALCPLRKRSHRIGLLMDKAIEEELRIRHLHVANAARATLGINVDHCVITPRDVGVTLRLSDSGASWGSINDIEALIEGAEALVTKGCTAIAVVVRFPEEEECTDMPEAAELFQAYRSGQGVDAIAGAESLISHIISQRLRIPCAHAPAFAPNEEADPSVSPKACAEELGYTFLPCCLAYLHRAPLLIPIDSKERTDSAFITAEDIDAVVLPIDALGGPAVLSFAAMSMRKTEGQSAPIIIAVAENRSNMKVEPHDLLMKESSSELKDNIIIARSYAEAAGFLAAHRAGILRDALTTTVPELKITEL